MMYDTGRRLEKRFVEISYFTRSYGCFVGDAACRSMLFFLSSEQSNALGRIRFCALILDFDEKQIFNLKFTINLLKYGIIG